MDTVYEVKEMDTVYVVSWYGDPDILIFKSLENAKKRTA